MRLAYFSPLTPQRSGISDYSEELLPHLTSGADITLFVDGFQPMNRELTSRLEVLDYRRQRSLLNHLGDFDAVVYHMGNDHRYHAGILEAMRRHSGIVVFHDFALHDFYLGLARERGDMGIYLDELAACHGDSERGAAAAALAQARQPAALTSPTDFPLNCRVARAAEGIIAHSEWSCRRLAQIAPNVPIARIQMPVKLPNQPFPDAPAPMEDGKQRQIRIACFGRITPGKGIEQILSVLAELRDQHHFHFTFAGERNDYFNVRALINRYGMSDRTTITGYLSLAEFERHIAETDIAINLRERYLGETSASLCRIMAGSVAAVVSNVGWFSELPDDCVVKIEAVDFGAALKLRLRELLENPELRSRIGANAHGYMQAAHALEKSARHYLSFINEVIEKRKAHPSAAHSIPRSDTPARLVPAPITRESAIALDAGKGNRKKPRIRMAYFSPLGPQHSGISDYSEELLPHLAAHLDIDLFVDGFRCNNPKITTYFRFFDYHRNPAELDRLGEYDVVLYHMGNDHRYHAGMYQVMRQNSGVVVFHDFSLQDFFLALARNAYDSNIYLDVLAGCHGDSERRRAEAFLQHDQTPPQFYDPIAYPLNCQLARGAEGIIVHSDWSRQRFEQLAPGVPVARINHHITARAAGTEVAHRKPAAGPVHIASFGIVTPDKGIARALRALGALRNEYDFHYTLVGSCDQFAEVRDLIARYGLQDRVTITGHVALTEFERRIAETDIAINLRERPVGATSGSLCRVMAAGVAAIVSNVAGFAELPGDAVVRVDNDPSMDVMLREYLRRLIPDADLRQRVGANARRHMLAEHNIELSAARYVEFIGQLVSSRTRRQFLNNIASEISALGIEPQQDAFLRNVAEQIACVAPNGNTMDEPAVSLVSGPKQSAPARPVVAGRAAATVRIDYKRAAVEYLGRLNPERQHHLRTKPFYNLANRPAKYKGEGMDEDMHRHFCDFANIAKTLALEPGSRILDVGCGSGWLSEYFARLGYAVKGVDISPDLVEMSRERVSRVPYGTDHETPLRCTFEVHDVELSPLSEKFDAVICYDSLHHFENERAVIGNIAAMLEMGGLVFVLEGARPDSGSAGEEELRQVMREFGTLEAPFDYDYLRGLLEENGLAIIGDYVSVNGLFERQVTEGDLLSLRNVPRNYHYLACKKVVEGAHASTVPDSRRPGVMRARIALLSPTIRPVEPGQRVNLELEIENTGDTLWLASNLPHAGIVMPAIRIIDDEQIVISEFHGEPALPCAVGPGETITLRIDFCAPAGPGYYTMKFDLVAEHICWFEQQGSTPLLIPFVVAE